LLVLPTRAVLKKHFDRSHLDAEAPRRLSLRLPGAPVSVLERHESLLYDPVLTYGNLTGEDDA
jgi:hypothetical protein